jgi:D-glycero-alpha-D-manno-heptose-7-phosphate kinase
MRVGPDADRSGLDLYLETDAPPGSGLGASSALVVSMIGAFQAWRRLSLSRYEIAHLAYLLERKDVGIAGGMQDQYSAAFGGFNLIEFNGERDVIVNPLRVDAPIVHELEYSSLLVFTGATRLSSRIIDTQVRGYQEGRPEVIDAFAQMKALAVDAKAALLRGQVLELGEILHKQWLHKKATSSAITNPHIDRLYDEARSAGAVGGKMNGAGGGGFMYLICPFDRKPAVISRLSALGAEVMPVAFDFDGMQSWLTNPQERSTRMAVAVG